MQPGTAMRLEPVYLVAPPPVSPTQTSRRAFLLAGGAFVFGSALGGACGYSLGASAGGGGAGDVVEAELKPSGDVELDELRRLAVKAPIEELVDRKLKFLDGVTKGYPLDAICWRGVERLADEYIGNPRIADRRAIGRWLAQVIEQGAPAVTDRMRPKVQDLKSLK